MKPQATFTLEYPDLNYAEDLFSYGKLPIFCEFIDAEPMIDISQARDFIQGLIDQNRRQEKDYYLVVSNRKCVGTMGLIYNRPASHKSALIGYGISPFAWGTNAFEQALGDLVSIARSKGLIRLEAITRNDNKSSVNALLKNGFETEGILKSYYTAEDEDGIFRVDAHISSMILT